MMLAALFSVAFAAEHLVWELRYLGMTVGSAEAHIEETGATRRIQAEAHSADWYRPVYALDDQLLSLSQVDGGFTRYTAVYREGDFAQDVDMRREGHGFAVSRSQRKDEGWRHWSDTYPGPPEPVHDALSVLVALRALELSPGARYTLPVFTGKEVVQMSVRVDPAETCEERACVPLQLSVGYGRDKRELRLWLSDDAQRLPLRATVWASGVKVEARLTAWSEDG